MSKFQNRELWSYITCHKEDDTSKQTHMWFGAGKGEKIMFRVEDNEYGPFLDLVATTIENYLPNAKSEALHLLELPLEIGVLCFDLDIKFSNDKSHKEFIEPIDIIEKINKIISTYFILPDAKSDLISYYFVKETPFHNKEREYYSDGIHITYPNIVLDSHNKNFIMDLLIDEIDKNGDFNSLMENLLIEKLNKKNITFRLEEDENIFRNEDGEPMDISNYKTEIIKEIFDRCVFGKTKWFMYGSGKETYKNSNVYKVKYIFDHESNEIDTRPSDFDLVKILAIRHKDKNQIIPNDREIIKYKNSKKNTIQNKIPNEKIPNEKISNEKILNNNTNFKVSGPGDTELAKKLIKLLKKERAGPYETWRNVGLVLHGISDTLLPEFIEFSKMYENCDIPGCNKFWKRCQKPTNDNKLTIASLKFWAKEDNPDEYRNLYSEYLNGCSLEDMAKINEILKNLNFEHDHDVALLIKSLYGRLFKCSSVKMQSWHHFDNHRWNYCDGGYKLSNLISEHFTKYIYNMYVELTNDHLKDMKDENIKKKKEIYYKFITKLNKNTYKKLLMGECTNSFYENNFVDNLDEIVYLIGFENGVYDLKNMEFRDGVPEDKITFSTGYNYNMDYSEDHPDIIEIERVIKLIQPGEGVKNFMMCHIASFLEGGNKDQKCVFWIGPGGANGKSTIQNLISNAFGRYYKYIENSIITKERGKSNEANPDIIELKGVRITILSELEPGVKIHAGFLKRLTGGDPLRGRGLYSPDIIEFIPQFKMILISNILPEFNSVNDNAVWRRIRVINFGQKFVENPKAKNEHKIDNNLPKKLESLKSAFMWLLINKYYPMYVTNGLDKLTPECVMEATNRAKADTEPYLKFTEDLIVYDDNAKDTKINDIIDAYKEWFEGIYNKKTAKAANIIDYFVGEGCAKKGRLLMGVKLDYNKDVVSNT
jgi:P4 family phage/plasmid primase-like protien